MPWKNFSIWRGRLPHWRADDVCFYVTFRYRRPLTEIELGYLMNGLRVLESKGWSILIFCALPEAAEMLIEAVANRDRSPVELSKAVEAMKAKVAKAISKGEKSTRESASKSASMSRFAMDSPFYSESYDRIMRDDAEREEFWLRILGSPVEAELAEDPENYPFLWAPGAD